MRRPYRNSEEMYPLVESYLAGRQTREAFCAERGLSVGIRPVSHILPG
jgi:hypothetical protein